MEEKNEPERKHFKFGEMDTDELLGWWIFYKMDDGGIHTPPNIIQVIKDFRKFNREGVVEILDKDYN